MSDFLSPTPALREAFLTGRPDVLPELRPDVRQGWERSLAAGVDPALTQVPLLLEGSPLHEYRDSHEVYRAGLPALEAASALLAGTGCGVVLSDAQGMVLYVAGDTAMLHDAEQVGSLPGASWREDAVGNNAIGSALVTRAAVQFHSYEHWCAGWDRWICAAAPIVDRPSGLPLAAIALVANRPAPDARMLQMVARLAGSVEHQLQGRQREQEAQLRAEAMKLQRWFPENAILALNPRGGVVWTGGSVPPGLLTTLRQDRMAWPLVGMRGEREVLIGGRYPCLAIPVWSGSEPCGYVLTVKLADSPAIRTPVTRPARKQIIAGNNGRRLVFSPDQVLAVRVIGGQIQVVTDSGQWPTAYKSMREVEELLPAEHFFLADRGCLVNLSQIKEIHPMFNRTVTLVLADRKRTEIPVSRRRTAALRELIPF